MVRTIGVVNKQNVSIWGIERVDENSFVVMNSPDVLKWFAPSKIFV